MLTGGHIRVYYSTGLYSSVFIFIYAIVLLLIKIRLY